MTFEWGTLLAVGLLAFAIPAAAVHHESEQPFEWESLLREASLSICWTSGHRYRSLSASGVRIQAGLSGLM